MSGEHPFLDVLRRMGLYRPEQGTPSVDLSDMPVAPAGDERARRYAEAALRYEERAVANCDEGARNDTLNRASFKLGSLVAAGHLGGREVIDTLTAAALASGLAPSEIKQVSPRAVRDGGKEARAVRLVDYPEVSAAYTILGEPMSTNGHGEHHNADDNDQDDDIAALVGDIDNLYPVLDWPTVWQQSPDDVEWLAHPLFERGRLYSLFSAAKAGKSLLMLDVCAALATGSSALGNPPLGDPVTVLYVDLENSTVDLVERLQDLDYQPEQLTRLKYLSFPSLPVLDSRRGGLHLLATARHHGADVVVIDTVSRLIEGRENDADTFHALYRYAMAPLKADGVTVVRLDHLGKDEERGMRGSSAKISDVDVAWKLTKPAEESIRLDRVASRTSHAPEYVTIDQLDAPLRHVLTQGDMSDEVSSLVATLDRLGVPAEYGRPKAASVLRAGGFKVRNETLSEAVRVRQNSVTEGA